MLRHLVSWQWRVEDVSAGMSSQCSHSPHVPTIVISNHGPLKKKIKKRNLELSFTNMKFIEVLSRINPFVCPYLYSRLMVLKRKSCCFRVDRMKMDQFLLSRMTSKRIRWVVRCVHDIFDIKSVVISGGRKETRFQVF